MGQDAEGFDARDLEALFEGCFRDRFATILVGGAEEPLYLPSVEPDRAPHRILYREDFFASALHEVAHWCIAGARRRLLEDYGYWYAPDGRDAEQQAAFERSEASPQALERIFSEACGFEFHLSADNLEGTIEPSRSFARLVADRRQDYLTRGLPPRADIFRAALEKFSRPSLRVQPPQATPHRMDRGVNREIASAWSPETSRA
jgi:elongation factor P hydroxylase